MTRSGTARRARSDGPAVDIAEAGYAAVREAFNRVLDRCTDRLSRKDYQLAFEVLALEQEPPQDSATLIADTALFSRPGNPFTRTARKRAIDRHALSALANHDLLEAQIAAMLPSAFFSVFRSERSDADGRLEVTDLLDEKRRLTIMDHALAATASPGTLFAGRFLDLGPWHIGFGIIVTLRRSEAAAVLIALSHEGEISEKRDSLHELVYQCRLNDADLVMAAVQPLISVVAFTIDQSEEDVADLAAMLGSLVQLPDEA